nr:nucleolar protein 6 [Ipomoea batatas]
MASDSMDSMTMRISELLKEVQLDYSPANTKIINDVVSSIKEAIDKIPENKVTADLAPGFIRDINADKVEFTFKKPLSIEIGGSYAMQCVVKPDINVDLLLRLPKECFHEKDYLNHRYHAKRFLYLCKIKKHLDGLPQFDSLRWSAFQNEARKPILVVSPAAKLVEKTGFIVRIIPTATSLFNPSKLRLERNNIRSLNQGDVIQATPKYNSSILEDLFIEYNAEFIKSTFSEWKELKEALILLKVWARQRSSIYVHDCLNGFLVSLIIAFLAKRTGSNSIKNIMTAMQIFRVTLEFIANSKIWDQGLLFKVEGENSDSIKDRRIFFQQFPVVICNSSVELNLAFRLSQSGFQELRNEARLALICIKNCRDGGFDELFMTKIDFPAKYDYCIRLNLQGHHDFHKLGFCLDDECWRSYENKVLSVLNQGLTDRSKLVRVIWKNTVGSFKKAIMGPSHEEKDKALEFRKFWGDKATLRQFRDNRIAEVAVWECKEWEKHLIMKDIVEYVLSRHLSITKENIIPIAGQLDFTLLQKDLDPISFSTTLLGAFEELSKRLRQLNDIPLKVSSVQALDPAFRLTSVFPPAPHPLAYEKGMDTKLQKPISTCLRPLELEGSGNWPMDEVAIEKTKSAFLLNIGESLQNNWGMTCTATEDDVEVLMSGFAFRLKILHERALSLVNGQINSGQSKLVLTADKRLLLHNIHAGKINGLRGRYPIYGPVVRLAKRWVSAHLFSTLLAEEAIELLVAHLFLSPLPFDPPCSRITGFLRFLRLLSEYDWMFSPLVIDFHGVSTNEEKQEGSDFTTEDMKKINASAKLNINFHDLSVLISMFLATKYDLASETWTRSTPAMTELKRLVAYATSSANLLTKLISQDECDSYGWKCLFRTPLSNYDAVVLLHRDKLPYPHHLLFPSELEQDLRGRSEELKSKLMVNFDPLRCFISEIEREFPDTFKIWYDSLGGDAIGLTWGKASSKKRGRDSMAEGEDPLDLLKSVGEKLIIICTLYSCRIALHCGRTCI